MNKLASLQIKAVNAAKNSNWDQAVTINEEILELDQKNLGALNRLGLSYLQIQKPAKAKKCFKQVLEIDTSNNIAKKNLEKIKNNQNTAPSFSQEHFIEEPGKTKIVELHRLAGKETLNKLAPGLVCELKIKKRYISIEHDGNYIGTLPEDLSFRLTKLIKRNNTYECFIHSACPKSTFVYIKEANRSEQNENIHSFPLNKNLIATISDIDESFLLDDNIPMEIINTDTDEEKGIDSSTLADPEQDKR
ncbi:MAG: tetratricopeptide repeat protein [Candidatus Pacebacteria bacterium]|nr:tetratricopeptide repeat protein [Candidatus Paceibacterota bacterium]